MKSSILSSLETLPYFTTEAVKQLMDGASTNTVRMALYRWMKSDQIIALKKGVYMTRRFFERYRADSRFTGMVSAVLLPQSYLSTEYVLQRHGILTDITYPVTAITVKQTRAISNPLGTFTFRNIKQDLYLGFMISDFLGIPIAQASLAKALFDYLYLRPARSLDFSATGGLAESLRLNLDGFAEHDVESLQTFVEISMSKKMDRILASLRKTVWRH